MLLPRTVFLLLASRLCAAQGPKQSLPFLLFSSQALDIPHLTSQQIASADDVDKSLAAVVPQLCNTEVVLLMQRQRDAPHVRQMPYLQRRAAAVTKSGSTSKTNGTLVQIPDLRDGPFDVDAFETSINSHCGRETADGHSLRLMGVGKDSDNQIEEILAPVVARGRPYVVIYAMEGDERHGIPEKEERIYEMDESYPELHTDLRRDIDAHASRRRDDDSKGQVGLPLFETYQFLSPAIFMGLSVSLLLGLILYMGITAIANLEVTYKAFTKENGPNASKAGKQQ